MLHCITCSVTFSFTLHLMLNYILCYVTYVTLYLKAWATYDNRVIISVIRFSQEYNKILIDNLLFVTNMKPDCIHHSVSLSILTKRSHWFRFASSSILKCYYSLKVLDGSPASSLYHWFGNEEWNETAIKYKITNDTSQSQFSSLIWNLLREEINNL